MDCTVMMDDLSTSLVSGSTTLPTILCEGHHDCSPDDLGYIVHYRILPAVTVMMFSNFGY